MLLGFTNGRNFDITGAINGDDAHSTVAHSHVLTEFAQYVCDGLLGDGLYDSQVSNLRLQIVEKLGEKALIDTVAVIGMFNGINRVAEERLKLIFNDNLENAANHLSEFMRSLEVPLNLNEIKVPVQEWNNIVDDAFLGERGKNFIGNKEAFISSAKSMGLY